MTDTIITLPDDSITGRRSQTGAAFSQTDIPELGSIAIRFPNVFFRGKPLAFRNFLSYDYRDHFLRESDGWEYTLAQDALSEIDLIAIVPRTRVEVSIDDVVQSIGILDNVRVRSGKSGTIVSLTGRNWLSPAVDSHIDPNVRLKASMPLIEVLNAVFGPFGMQVIAADNDANRNAITGRIYGARTTKKGKTIASYLLHELKPYPQEGAFKFAERVCQRFGLWIWAGQDGHTIIVGKPDFEQEPRYELRHSVADPSRNNIEEGDVDRSCKDQPSCILACGSGGGGEFAHSTLRSGIANPVIDADISSIRAAYPSVKFLPPPDAMLDLQPITDPSPRPLFLYDAESHTQAQLDAFVLRELSLLTRKSLTAKYTIMGHRINGQPVAVDTIASVNDDRSNLHLPLWVMGRSFSKKPGSGGTSTIDLIRPGSLQF